MSKYNFSQPKSLESFRGYLAPQQPNSWSLWLLQTRQVPGMCYHIIMLIWVYVENSIHTHLSVNIHALVRKHIRYFHLYCSCTLQTEFPVLLPQSTKRSMPRRQPCTHLPCVNSVLLWSAVSENRVSVGRLLSLSQTRVSCWLCLAASR